MPDTILATPAFRDLQLNEALLTALDEVGYEIPTPIQAQAIPHLLQGLDLLGNAPTGTGKTAAFALPLLSRLDLESNHVQVITLTPTRELAIQVAEAFKRYAAHIPGFHVLPIYGGQEYNGQIRALKRGVHVVVGTPGRVMDHMRKGTLKLDHLQAVVLDEADEMLRMGFIDEVKWILEKTPSNRQMALFSATMPKEVERIARRYLDNPQEISVETGTATAETIRQRFWQVSGMHKLDALTRILEVEPFDAILMFVRTKTATVELAEKLEARGYAAAAMNGDMVQSQRELMVERLKKGTLDILVATDVAARGLDVDRISHVVNYDIPYDAEAYIHRIGRTGRAGRTGDAILFVAPRERRMLATIERATRQKIEPLELPTTELVNTKRINDFKQKITDTLAAGELSFMQDLIEQYQQEHDIPAIEIASALAKISIGDRPLLMKPDREKPVRTTMNELRPDRDRASAPRKGARGRNSRSQPDADKQRYRIAVGYRDGVKPGNIVGAIANEAGLDSANIGHIEIDTTFSLVDLPSGLSPEVFADLKDVKICGKRLNLTPYDPDTMPRSERSESAPRGRRDAYAGSKRSDGDKPAWKKGSAKKSFGKKFDTKRKPVRGAGTGSDSDTKRKPVRSDRTGPDSDTKREPVRSDRAGPDSDSRGDAARKPRKPGSAKTGTGAKSGFGQKPKKPGGKRPSDGKGVAGSKPKKPGGKKPGGKKPGGKKPGIKKPGGKKPGGKTWGVKKPGSKKVGGKKLGGKKP